MKLKHIHFDLGDEISITTGRGHDVTVRYDTDGKFTVSDERIHDGDAARLYMADANAQVLRLDAGTGWHVNHQSGEQWIWSALSIVMWSLYSQAQARAGLKETI